MRISDWSSDVCSSDLRPPVAQRRWTMPAHESGWRTRSAYSMSTAAERGDVVVRVAPSPVCHAMPHPSDCTAVKDVKASSPSDRQSVVSRKSVSVRVDLGGRRIIKKENQKKTKN